MFDPKPLTPDEQAATPEAVALLSDLKTGGPTPTLGSNAPPNPRRRGTRGNNLRLVVSNERPNSPGIPDSSRLNGDEPKGAA